MDDPKAVYAAKREALVKAQDLLDDLATCLRLVGGLVERWDQVLLPGETKELNALQDLGYSDPIPIQINVKDWITNEAFFDALRSWRSVRALAQQAYEVLTDFEDVEPLPEAPSQRPEKRRYYPPVRPRPRGLKRPRKMGGSRTRHRQ